jgi:hypothetical protein
MHYDIITRVPHSFTVSLSITSFIIQSYILCKKRNGNKCVTLQALSVGGK